jgi:hypothetical protein
MADMVRKGHRAIAHGAQQIASIEHPLGRKARCARCQDSGSVWIVCPDAGAVKVPCGCRREGGHGQHHVGLADIGAAVVFAGGCAALFMLL